MNIQSLTLSALLLITASLTGCSQTASSPNITASPVAAIGSEAPATSTVSQSTPPDATAAAVNQPASRPIVANAADSSTPGNASRPITESNPIAPALTAGEYCYQVQTNTMEGTARLTVSANQRVTGQTNVTIHNDDAGYYTSYQQALEGRVRGEQLQLKIVTQIEGDTQVNNENWIVTGTGIETGRESYTEVNCGAIATNPVPPRSNTPPGRIEFAAGTDAATVNNAVVRGERDRYLLRANGGQQMDVLISSTEDNAVFDVVAPDGQVLQQEATSWNGSLPMDGDYQIVVGGTRGNATYEMTVQIQ